MQFVLSSRGSSPRYARDVRWLLLTSALVAQACWTGPVEPPPAAPSTEPRPPRPVSRYAFDSLTLQRTGCMGACPTYTVTVFANGDVRWVGQDNVATMGMRTGRVARAQIAALVAKLEAIDFFTYDEYGAKKVTQACTTVRSGSSVSVSCSFRDIVICTDTSHAIVTLVRGRTKHEVDNAHCRPSPLTELEQLIDEVARTREWIDG